MAIDLEETYKDLHEHPELSYQEHRTAKIAADGLRALGIDVVEDIGRTGVAGVLANGDGPTVLLRADMDALPVAEETSLDYASTQRATDPDGNDVPVMHACGHDVHVTCLLGAAEALVGSKDEWHGTVVFVFQPAEEVGSGAHAMVDDGLYDRVPKPDIVLGQHVAPAPAGVVGVHAGPAFAATDDVIVTLHGEGGHGSRPEATIDPVVMAAATVMRLQTIVSREIAGGETAVVTVGTLHAGTKINIIPPDATLGINIRTYDTGVRDRVVAAIERIANGEAAASGAPRMPDVETLDSFPVLHNDEAATERTIGAFRAAFGAERVIDPGRVTGSEDVGTLATAAGVPIVYWLLGGLDPSLFTHGLANGTTDADIPSNHSPHFAPLIHPTLETGVQALVVAAREWLG
ncbi:amidohydrolase [Humibacter ginsenosidimutans]|uniref:Amidohydrolase n=1 Tax=Humibacter ginsenosidimutans TaxID=2599293 RepID=A0A5B8M8Z9_9MICO|nr:amidohydrolase [Humibacter ginsenosidimutans]QDZ16075.1 amidohydrolase [Humibacter ginsenosidimutans]